MLAPFIGSLSGLVLTEGGGGGGGGGSEVLRMYVCRRIHCIYSHVFL